MKLTVLPTLRVYLSFSPHGFHLQVCQTDTTPVQFILFVCHNLIVHLKTLEPSLQNFLNYNITIAQC